MIVDTDATRALRVGVDESVRVEKAIESSNLPQNFPFQAKALPCKVSRQLGKLDGEVRNRKQNQEHQCHAARAGFFKTGS